MKIIFYVLFLGFLINSCSNPGEDYANKLCSCMKESGLKNGLNQRDFTRSFNRNEPCFEEIGKEFYFTLKEMDDSQRANFMKQFSKALLETDCADIAFNLIPYDEMLKEMGRKFENDLSSKFNFNGAEICDCVNMKDYADQKLKSACKELEMEWKEKYENADDLGKKRLIKEVEDCDKNR
jgi:hypothetical protein